MGIKSVVGVVSIVMVAAGGVTPAAVAAAAPGSPPATASHASSAQQGGIPRYEIRYIKKVCRWIIQDMRSVNLYMTDGIAVDLALDNLAQNYDRLVDSPAPPGVRKSKYYARVSTLADFTYRAADSYYYDERGASARYYVVRKETKPVFRAINDWLGTKYKVPFGF